MVLMAACSVRCGVLCGALVCRNWLALRFSGTVLPRNAVCVTSKIMFRARRGRLIPSRLRVPAPLAGRRAGTGTTPADAPPRGEPNPSPGTQFQQPFTDGPDLSSGTVGVRGLQT